MDYDVARYRRRYTRQALIDLTSIISLSPAAAAITREALRSSLQSSTPDCNSGGWKNKDCYARDAAIR